MEGSRLSQNLNFGDLRRHLEYRDKYEKKCVPNDYFSSL